MPSWFNRCGRGARRARSFRILSGCCALGVALFAYTLVGSFSLAVHAGQSRTVKEGVYTDDQAKRGQALYEERCRVCHGPTLGGDLGPPLTGDGFLAEWNQTPLSELVNKIQNTMPANDPGKLARPQVTDLVAYILQVGKFPAGRAELSADEAALKQITWPLENVAQANPVTATPQAPAFPAVGNLAQVMRGILFPSSNIIFNVQGQDPGAPRPPYQPGQVGFSWADWGAGIYSGWELVDYAAVALAEAAPLLLKPGRRCENGKPVPVERADWVKFTQELVETGRAAYRASQSRNQDTVIEITDKISDACLNCHVVYREKGAGPPTDPSNKAARCVP